MLHNIIVGCTHPRSMLLAMLTTYKELHAASNVDHLQRVAWVSISKYASCSVPIVMALHLVAIWDSQALLLTAEYPAIPKHFLKQ